ncbi:DNA polymerase III subunit beta [Ureaplasma parvum]|uniref:DNA pol III beta chain n=3 Tax=Ureaplasma parvum TaxID=134821 RepID=Q9PR66_UREPA|nr:DNA polymerase III subunit beta [Ureaplasma parvum]pir/C82937/ DNA pol III beta chain UU079 [imported] - Ureaplasma urealyticum [Ureaplasma urealyticum]AAF30484.1 DNA pol III beta chain [Ureaplasma parvum serovar 3 str. ATCC 700970]ACA32758.1 DNA polymerase III, beta subunit [Ureaplasma parvum serovar 3 str. ATCC 27815]ASD24565.1 DNA polymerase III subunit beta [Ureaplasma parvum]ASD25156.1 DNA polymerase III subunit beta [Ureaplasma parvum]ASD28911.1 DNA polymerase III subunit beta [Ureap
MEVFISIKKLIEAIKFSTTIANTNNANALLLGVLIEVSQNKISFKTTNNQVSGYKEITEGFEYFNSGKVLVTAKIILGLISKLKDKSVLLKQIDTNILLIKTENFETQINTMNIEGFPNLNFSLEDYVKISLPHQIMQEINTKVLPNVLNSQGIEKIQPISGILIDTQTLENKLIAIGTDKIKASCLIREYMGEKFKFIVSYSTMKLIIEILKNVEYSNNQTVDFYVRSRSLIFKINDAILQTRMIDGVYPNIYSIFDETNEENTYVFDRRLLIEIIERGMNIVMQEQNPKISIRIDKNEAEISLTTFEIGNMKEKMSIVNLNNKSAEFILNPSLLAHVLKNFDNNDVTFKVKDEILRPIIFIDTKDVGFKQILSRIKN